MNGVQVEGLLLGDDAQDVLPRGQAHAVLAEPLERSPPSGAGDSDQPGDVHAVDLGVPAAVAERTADESLDPIHARLSDVDGVAEPFATLEIVDDVPRRIPGRGDDVHVHVGPILPALICRSQVVIGDAFAAVVEVFSLLCD